MAKTYRPYVPEQDLLLPPSLRDWLPEDHLAYFVSDLVDHLDLSAITAVYEDEERGYPPYHPVMLTKVLVYAYCVGVFSSRRIQRRLVEDIAFRVLAAGNDPDFRTIADFRKTHLTALQGFFEQVLRRGARPGRAAGRPRGARWEQGEGERVEAQGDELRPDARETTAAAGRGEGSCSRRRRRPMRPRTRSTARIGAATNCRRSCSAARVGCSGFARRHGPWRRARRQEAAAAGEPAETAKPDPKAQYNFTDPESRIMKGPDGFVQAYNVQVAVDEQQLIVGQAVTQETNDKKQLMPMITTIDAAVGRHAHAAARRRRLLLGREPDRDRRPRPSTPTSRRGSRNMASGPGPVRAGRCRRPRRWSTGCPASCTRKAGAAVYAARKAIVEPVIGQIKQARGFRQFLLRGFEKVQGEWSLVCTTHNILKLYRLCG